MTSFRKKPVVIEAFQWKGDWPPFLHWLDSVEFRIPFGTTPQIRVNADRTLSVDTIEGTMLGQVNDFIIRGVQGEFYPCKPDIFEATYDAVEATP